MSIFATLIGALSSPYAVAATTAMTTANTIMNGVEISKLNKIQTGVDVVGATVTRIDRNVKYVVNSFDEFTNDFEDFLGVMVGHMPQQQAPNGQVVQQAPGQMAQAIPQTTPTGMVQQQPPGQVVQPPTQAVNITSTPSPEMIQMMQMMHQMGQNINNLATALMGKPEPEPQVEADADVSDKK